MSLGDNLGIDKMLMMKLKPVFILLKVTFKISLKKLYLKKRKTILVE